MTHIKNKLSWPLKKEPLPEVGVLQLQPLRVLHPLLLQLLARQPLPHVVRVDQRPVQRIAVLRCGDELVGGSVGCAKVCKGGLQRCGLQRCANGAGDVLGLPGEGNCRCSAEAAGLNKQRFG